MSLSNNFGNIPVPPSLWKAIVYYRPIRKDEHCIFTKDNRWLEEVTGRRTRKGINPFFSFCFFFAKLKVHVAKAGQWEDHPAG